MSYSLRPHCSPPSSSVHGISQARILEWVAISFSKGSSQSRDLKLEQHCWCNCNYSWLTGEIWSLSLLFLSFWLWKHEITHLYLLCVLDAPLAMWSWASLSEFWPNKNVYCQHILEWLFLRIKDNVFEISWYKTWHIIGTQHTRLSWWLISKESACNAGDRFDP